ncbi:unnamed protein product, partial [Coregonus sp. 'balchen']
MDKSSGGKGGWITAVTVEGVFYPMASERSSYPVKVVLNKQSNSSQWRDGEMAVGEDSQPQPTDVEQRAETEPILIKDEETAEDVWKTDPQEELRITGEESGSKPGQPPSFEQRHCDEDFITQPNISPEDSVEHYPNYHGPEEPGTPRLTSTEKSKVFNPEQHQPAEDEDSLELVMVKDEKKEELDLTTALAGPDQFVMDETDRQLWTSVDPGRDTDPDGHPDFSFHAIEEYSQNKSIFPSHSGLPSIPTMTDDVGPSLHSSIGKHANMFSAAAHMKRHVRTLADETRQQMPDRQSSERLNSNNDGNNLSLQSRQHQYRASEATVRMSECMTGSNMATTSTFSGYSLSRNKTKETKQEEMVGATASDGTVKLWHPFQVSIYSVSSPVMHLYYCSILLGTCEDGNIIRVLVDADRQINKLGSTMDSVLATILRLEGKVQSLQSPAP